MSKITVSKIACKTIGVAGLGLGIADTLKGVGRFSTRGAEDAEIEHLYDTKLITKREFEIIKMSINDRTLGVAEDRNKLRAEILKGIIMVILS